MVHVFPLPYHKINFQELRDISQIMAYFATFLQNTDLKLGIQLPLNCQYMNNISQSTPFLLEGVT